VMAPSSAMTPPTVHAAMAAPALPVIWATSRGLKKMPTPMIAPTTTQVASHRLRTCASLGSETSGVTLEPENVATPAGSNLLSPDVQVGFRAVQKVRAHPPLLRRRARAAQHHAQRLRGLLVRV